VRVERASPIWTRPSLPGPHTSVCAIADGGVLPAAILPEGCFIKDSEGNIFNVAKNRNGDLEDVLSSSPKGPALGPRAARKVDPLATAIRPVPLQRDRDQRGRGTCRPLLINGFSRYRWPDGNRGDTRPSYGDMTFVQFADANWQSWTALDTGPFSPKASKERLQVWKVECQEWEQRREKAATSILFHIHREAAFSFACFGFTLIWHPAGNPRPSGRETNIGIAIALLLVAVYYAFVLVGPGPGDAGGLRSPNLIVWLPQLHLSGDRRCAALGARIGELTAWPDQPNHSGSSANCFPRTRRARRSPSRN